MWSTLGRLLVGPTRLDLNSRNIPSAQVTRLVVLGIPLSNFSLRNFDQAVGVGTVVIDLHDLSANFISHPLGSRYIQNT